jgi:predicted RecA/RadA family phage recombinase
MSSIVVNLARKVPTTSVLSLVKCPIVGKKAIARHALPRGAVLNVFKSPVLTYPTMHTVQLKEGVHVAPTDGAECISHQCGPDTNSAVVVADDCKSAAFVTTKDVAEGEEMTFNVRTAACRHKRYMIAYVVVSFV